jgi:hypothetical protein
MAQAFGCTITPKEQQLICFAIKSRGDFKAMLREEDGSL